jgi:hypothetical protein
MSINTKCVSCGHSSNQWKVQSATLLQVGKEVHFSCMKCDGKRHKVTKVTWLNELEMILKKLGMKPDKVKVQFT